MDDNTLQILQFSQQGFPCSQIMIKMGLALKDEDNPDLVRAMHGLALGCFTEKATCGALTGACCLISLFGGRALPDEYPHENLQDMTAELVDWFDETYGSVYGGMICRQIRMDGGPAEKKQRCGEIIVNTCNKALEIMAAHDLV